MNVIGIIGKTIPQGFREEYQVLIVFDQDQLLYKIRDDLEQAISRIDDNIRQRLKGRARNLRIDYLPVFQAGSGTPIQDLYVLTHDRRLLSNYYSINATHGYVATKYDKNKAMVVATEDQTLTFHTILDGIKNPDQRFESLPIVSNRRFLQKFCKCLKRIEGSDIPCYSSISSDPYVVEIGISEVENRVLNTPQDYLI